MIRKYLIAFVALPVVLAAAPPTAIAQTPDGAMSMRTPDGQPHISGIFTFRTLTPFQRPEQFDGRENLSEEEAAEFEASERIRQNRDLFDPEMGANQYGRGQRAVCCHTTSSGMSAASS